MHSDWGFLRSWIDTYICFRLLAPSGIRILKLIMSSLDPTMYQVGFWHLCCLPEGGTTVQICGFSLAHRPHKTSMHASCLPELSLPPNCAKEVSHRIEWGVVWYVVCCGSSRIGWGESMSEFFLLSFCAGFPMEPRMQSLETVSF